MTKTYSKLTCNYVCYKHKNYKTDNLAKEFILKIKFIDETILLMAMSYIINNLCPVLRCYNFEIIYILLRLTFKFTSYILNKHCIKYAQPIMKLEFFVEDIVQFLFLLFFMYFNILNSKEVFFILLKNSDLGYFYWNVFILLILFNICLIYIICYLILMFVKIIYLNRLYSACKFNDYLIKRLQICLLIYCVVIFLYLYDTFNTNNIFYMFLFICVYVLITILYPTARLNNYKLRLSLQNGIYFYLFSKFTYIFLITNIIFLEYFIFTKNAPFHLKYRILEKNFYCDEIDLISYFFNKNSLSF